MQNDLYYFLNKTVFGIASGAIIFGGVVPYYFQYREIVKSQNAKGFSLYVCLTLLVANVLRVLFWIGKQFEVQLLVQSIVMIICMLFVIEVSVRIGRKQILPPHRSYSLWDGYILTSFWQWSDFSSYLVVILWFSALMLSVTYTFVNNSLFIDVLGFLALFTEAILGAPQFISNWRRKSTHGMSVKMVLMWLSGDIAKTVYFVVRETPAQFWLCGSLQVCVDIAILLQALFYSNIFGYKRIIDASGRQL